MVFVPLGDQLMFRFQSSSASNEWQIMDWKIMIQLADVKTVKKVLRHLRRSRLLLLFLLARFTRLIVAQCIFLPKYRVKEKTNSAPSRINLAELGKRKRPI